MNCYDRYIFVSVNEFRGMPVSPADVPVPAATWAAYCVHTAFTDRLMFYTCIKKTIIRDRAHEKNHCPLWECYRAEKGLRGAGKLYMYIPVSIRPGIVRKRIPQYEYCNTQKQSPVDRKLVEHVSEYRVHHY